MTNTAPQRSGIFAVALVALAACGSGSTASPDASNDASNDAAVETSTDTPSCADYCATIQTACTTSHQQYSDLDACMKSCVAFPVGTASDTTGDTLGCRVNHAHLAAASASSAVQHCPHAGPGGAGVCGSDCDGFCDIVMTYCTDANAAKIYASPDACMTDCAAHGTDVTFTAGDPGRTDMGNEVACILYHAQMGAVAPVSHCLGDLALTADTCR